MGTFHNAHFPNLQTNKKDRAVLHVNQLRGRHVSMMPTPMASTLHVLQTLLTEKASTSNIIYIIDDSGVEAALF